MRYGKNPKKKDARLAILRVPLAGVLLGIIPDELLSRPSTEVSIFVFMRLCTHEMGSFRCPSYHSSVMMMMMIGSFIAALQWGQSRFQS